MRLLLTSFIIFMAATIASAEISLTVYSSADPAGFDPQQFIANQRHGYQPHYVWQVPGFGVVKDIREVEFKDGRNVLGFTDVAEYIDPTTVSFVDLDKPDATRVLEQQFLFDLVSPQKLLDKYIDQQIRVTIPIGDQVETITGKLLSNNQGQLVIATDQGIRMVYPGQGQVQLGNLPDGLITRPTLQWLVNSDAAGKRKVRTTYQTAGITWKSDYNLVLNADDTKGDLGAWVTLMNLSGTSYPDAQLKLIAGDVQRIQRTDPSAGAYYAARAQMAMDAAAEEAFQQKSFYEYHLYTLPRRTDVAQNTTQQITLFPTVTSFDLEKVLVYDGAPEARAWVASGVGSPYTDRAFGDTGSKKVDAYIRFDNKEDNGLGIPLPRGKMRVYKQDDADGTLEFIGEDLIDHTSKNEQVLVRTGQSFDVTGQRTQTDFEINVGGHVIIETFRITVSNAKDVPQKVLISETLYRWVNWEITRHTDEYKKLDSRRIQFEVTVPPEGKKVVEYTVKYTW